MKITERENILLRRALDKATAPAEAEMAAKAFVESLRKRGVSGYDFVSPERSGPPPRPQPQPEPPKPEPPPQEYWRSGRPKPPPPKEYWRSGRPKNTDAENVYREANKQAEQRAVDAENAYREAANKKAEEYDPRLSWGQIAILLLCCFAAVLLICCLSAGH